MPNLTFTGDVITDAIRAQTAPVSDDGYGPPDSTVGVWEATGNVITSNPGFDSGATGWSSPDPGVSLAAVANDGAPTDGTTSLRVDLPATSGAQGVRQSGVTVVANTTYTLSAWVKGVAGSGYTIALANSSNTVRGTANFTATGAWQVVSCTGTMAAGETSAQVIVTRQTRAGVESFQVDSFLLEAKSYRTPYAPTARAAARITAPASALMTPQSWIALRVRLPWAAAAPYGAQPYLFDLYQDINNRLSLSYLPASSQFALTVTRANATQQLLSAAQSFVVATDHTLIARWTAAGVGLSVDGGAFGTLAAVPPSLAAATVLELGGSTGGGNQLDGNIHWAAAGLGTLSDADAATIHGFGNTDPLLTALPTTALATFLWGANDATYYGADLSGTLVIADRPAGEGRTTAELDRLAAVGQVRVYDKGDVAPLEAVFAYSGAAMDPATVTLRVKDPAGSTTVSTNTAGQVRRDAAGQYGYPLALNQAGVWYYRFEGVGGVAAAAERWLLVRGTQF